MFRLREENGTILILVAVGMVAFLGFLALVIDGGNLYLYRNRLARAADASALAGAQELPDYPAAAEVKASEYAEKNGVEPGRLSVTVSDDNKSITVETAATVDYSFARFLGFTQNNVSARAKAIVGNVKGMKGLVPLELKESDLKFDEETTIKVGGGQGNQGAYGALDLDGNPGGGSKDYENRLADGYEGVVTLSPPHIYIETGNMAEPTDRGLLERLGTHANCTCTYNNYTPDCPRLVYTPVVRPLAGDSSGKKREIIGFAAFFITNIELEGQGAEKKAIITGYFVKTVADGEVDQSGQSGDFGLKAVKLIE